MINLLIWLGLTRRLENGKLFVPFSLAPLWMWKHPIATCKMSGFVYLFQNLPTVVKWTPGRLLPRRWGFGIAGLIEFGDRG